MAQETKDDSAAVSTNEIERNSMTELNISGVAYIAAGNNQRLSPTDLGGVNYDTRERSTVNPIYGKDSQHQDSVMALTVHNPDNSQLHIDLTDYKVLSPGQTRDLRIALMETYQREASTGYGTDQLTQTAQYFKSIQWVVLKDADTLHDSAKLEQSFVNGELSGSFLRKTPEEQSKIFNQQHNELLESIDRALNKEIKMDNKPIDPIVESLSGQRLFDEVDVSRVQIMAPEKADPSKNPATPSPTTLNELLDGHKQQDQILSLVLQKQTELAQPNHPVVNNQQELG